jgi:lipopolysaccharide biosynthesis glycosyltransferase
MNCIFCCVFYQEKYVDMFFLLLESIIRYGNLDAYTHIFVYTSSLFMNIIKHNPLYDEEKIKFGINDTYDSIDKACKSRLDLFDLPFIQNYEKIIYLDTDILVKKSVCELFEICKENILYVLEEGRITSDTDYWGKTLFGNEQYSDITAFTSGILLFNNCDEIKNLFNIIKKDIIDRPYNLSFYDQPYFVYNAFKYKLYNNKILKSYVVSNNFNIHSNYIIYHFPGGPGNYGHKIQNMTIFLHKLKQQHNTL